MKNEWNADPEKYSKLAAPFESPEQAKQALEAFCDAVGKLREQYKIPELFFRFQVYVQTDEGVAIARGGAGFGDQLLQAQLAKDAADAEFEALRAVLMRLAGKFPSLHRNLITDPNTMPKDIFGKDWLSPAL